jgi:hypothetical protein
VRGGDAPGVGRVADVEQRELHAAVAGGVGVDVAAEAEEQVVADRVEVGREAGDRQLPGDAGGRVGSERSIAKSGSTWRKVTR